MSLKKVVLVLAIVGMPAAVLADGVTFGFIGGTLTAVQPANSSLSVIGSVATNSGATLYYVSRFSGNTIPSGPLVVPNGAPLPPQIAPTFGTYPGTFPLSNNFGSVTWTTGAATAFAVGATSSSATYAAAGSSILITGSGGPVGSGTLFSGAFSGPTTIASISAPQNPTCTTCSFWYSLTGPVSGTLDPTLLALLGLPSGGTTSGLFFSFIVGFAGPNDTVGVVEGGNLSLVVTPIPEPGTLALFGTGLIGVAAFIRRRLSLKSVLRRN